ncbi:MAG: hypothetical protein P0S95_00610 [Rhabdochlamydiaceae bacterium]|nr:hypothetical protein [Candidatus Amphrikana amoebophyrae]
MASSLNINFKLDLTKAVLKQYEDFNRDENPSSCTKIGQMASSLFWGTISVGTSIGSGLKTALCCDCRRVIKKASDDLLFAKPSKMATELTACLYKQAYCYDTTKNDLTEILTIVLISLKEPKETFATELSKTERAHMVILANSLASQIKDLDKVGRDTAIRINPELHSLTQEGYLISNKHRTASMGIETRALMEIDHQLTFTGIVEPVERALQTCELLLSDSRTGMGTISFGAKSQFKEWIANEPQKMIHFALRANGSIDSKVSIHLKNALVYIGELEIADVSAGSILPTYTQKQLQSLQTELKAIKRLITGTVPRALDDAILMAETRVGPVAAMALKEAEPDIRRIVADATQDVPGSLLRGLFGGAAKPHKE